MERPKLQAVARAAGVSVSTVSKVLNGRPDVAPATRTRVAELLGRAGYPDVGGRGGRGGRRGRAGELVEVVVNRLDDTSTSKLLRAVCLEAYRRGMGVVVTDVEAAAGRAGHPPRSWLDVLDARGAKAVVGLLVEFSQAQLSYFESQGVPACTLRMDEGDLGRVAAGHLLDLGHLRIAVVAGPAHERMVQACRETVSEAGADVPEGTSPSAVVFSADDAARASVATIVAEGLQVPRDVSVICCADSGAGEPDWPVTTVVQPWDVMARVALDSVSAGQAGHTVVTVPPRLVDRGSTAPPRLPR
jgi:LacI family transcriptional regulator